MKNERMNSSAFMQGIMIPPLLMAIIIFIGLITFEKSDSNNFLTNIFLYMLVGTFVLTPLILITLYFKLRHVEKGKAKGYLNSSFFWIMSLMMYIWFFFIYN